MRKRFLVSHDGQDYEWSPCKSTPSAAVAIAELPKIVTLLRNRGAKKVIDFGAGRGRNVQILSDCFEQVFLVEEDANIPHLKQLVTDINAKNVVVEPWNEYRSKSTPKVDAVLVCFVIHTLPTKGLRSSIIRTNMAHLHRGGAIVFVTPRNDAKYRPRVLADAVQSRDGIVRLYRKQETYSFYRNYTLRQFLQVVDHAGLQVEATILSDARMIFLTSPKQGDGGD